MNRIYLDAQSSAPIAPEVLEVMRPFFEGNHATAGSSHYSGKQVRKAIERAREQVASGVGASEVEEIIFTASGTEANNLAVQGLLAARKRYGKHAISTPLDHPSVWFSIQSMISMGFEHSVYGADSKGFLSELDSLKKLIRKETTLVAIPVSTPELGVLQDLPAVSELLDKRSIALFLDATTAGGWTPLSMEELKPSLMSFSPHRFHGPKGVGVLYKKRGVQLEPIIYGGNQEFGLRAGTENVASIVGVGKAFELMSTRLHERMKRAANLQAYLLKEIQCRIPATGFIGPPPGKKRICNQLNLVFEGVEGEALMLMANVKGLDCHTGVSCVNRYMENNRISKSIGIPDDLFRSSLLLSWHEGHDKSDIRAAIDIIEACVTRLREMSPVWQNLKSGRMSSRLPLLKG